MYVYRLSYPSIQSTNTASDRKVLRNEIQKKIVLIKICFTEKMYVSMYVCMYVCVSRLLTKKFQEPSVVVDTKYLPGK